MAIKSLPPSLPTDLPPAKLHLDDISEICEILKDDAGEEWRISFCVGDKVCDSIEDLKELGGRAKTFSINVSASDKNRSIGINRYSTSLNIYDYKDKSTGWSKFAKVESFFKKKRLGLYDRLEPLLLLCACLIIIGLVFQTHIRWKPIMTLPIGGFIGYYVAPRIFFPRSIVVLEYSHRVWSLRRFLEEHRSAIIVAILSAVMGAAFKAIADKLLK